MRLNVERRVRQSNQSPRVRQSNQSPLSSPSGSSWRAAIDRGKARVEPGRLTSSSMPLSNTSKEETASERSNGLSNWRARTLSQPPVLSDTSDSEDGQRLPINVKPLLNSSQPGTNRTLGPRRVIDKEKFRKALWDEEEPDLRSKRHLDGDSNDDAADKPLKKSTEIIDNVGRSACTPPPGETTVQPSEHCDRLRTRGYSFSVKRAQGSQCYDVGGFMCVSPEKLSATTNLREYRGKVALLKLDDLAHAGRFSSAGACALVVIVKSPKASSYLYKCCKDTRIPVVFISEVDAGALEHGSLSKLLFDVVQNSPPPPACTKISKNALQRRGLIASREDILPSWSLPKPPNNLIEISSESSVDSDGDAEFCLVRRREIRRQSRGSTPVLAKADKSIEQGKTQTKSSNISAQRENLLSSDFESEDQHVATLAFAIQEAICAKDERKKWNGVLRFRDLCKTKSGTVASKLINAVIHLPGVTDALWGILGGPTSVQESAESQEIADYLMSAQAASAYCLRNAALDESNLQPLLRSANSIQAIERVINNEKNEDLRQKVAALIANLSVEQGAVRAALCRDKLVVRGLCQLLFTSNHKAIDSSLAALSNLSLDERTTDLIHNELNMERIVMILLSGGSKACHRGAGLIRNLLYSSKTCEAVAQVPGMAKALQRLQTASDPETQQRASAALDLIFQYQQKSGLDVSMLERKLMDTGDQKKTPKVLEFSALVEFATSAPSIKNPAHALFSCEYDCGFTGGFEQVSAHESTCKLNPSTAKQSIYSKFVQRTSNGQEKKRDVPRPPSQPRQTTSSQGSNLQVKNLQKEAGSSLQKEPNAPQNTTLEFPDNDEIEMGFKAGEKRSILDILDMSKIDLFSPTIKPDSPDIAGASAFLQPSATPVRKLPLYDKASFNNGTHAQLPPGVHQRISGVPAPSTPPQLPSSRARLNKQAVNAPAADTPGWKIMPAEDKPSDLVSRMLFSTDPVDMIHAIQSLRERLNEDKRLKEESDYYYNISRAAQDEVGTDSRLLPLIARLLNDSSTNHSIQQDLLYLLRALCVDHAENLWRLCCNDSALSGLLKIALKLEVKGGRGENKKGRVEKSQKSQDKSTLANSAIAAEILTFCMHDDNLWDKFAAARSKLFAKKSTEAGTSRSLPLASVQLSHQAIIGQEWSA